MYFKSLLLFQVQLASTAVGIQITELWRGEWSSINVSIGERLILQNYQNVISVSIIINKKEMKVIGICSPPTPDVPDSKVHGANMGPIWCRQDPSGPHVGPMNFAIWGIVGNYFKTAFPLKSTER